MEQPELTREACADQQKAQSRAQCPSKRYRVGEGEGCRATELHGVLQRLVSTLKVESARLALRFAARESVLSAHSHEKVPGYMALLKG